MTKKETLQKIYHFYQQYQTVDMTDCDYYGGESYTDLNALNMLFDDSIPSLVKDGTVSRNSNLYRDSKPFLNHDVVEIMDDMEQSEFFDLLNRIVHKDLPQLLKKHPSIAKSTPSLPYLALKKLYKDLQALNRSDQKHGFEHNHEFNRCRIGTKNVNLAHYLESHQFILNYLGLATGKQIKGDLSSEQIKKGHFFPNQPVTDDFLYPVEFITHGIFMAISHYDLQDNVKEALITY